MRLGRATHTAGNRTRYVVEYDQWLLRGESLAGVPTVALTVAVSGVAVEDVERNSANEVIFYLDVDSDVAVATTFTVDIQIENTRDEIKNDQIEFYIVAP